MNFIMIHEWKRYKEKKISNTHDLWLIATTIGTPNLRALLICFKTFGMPFRSKSKFSSVYSEARGAPGETVGPPPCIFKALIVVTSTTALGISPEALHLILKNFSIPKKNSIGLILNFTLYIERQDFLN